MLTQQTKIRMRLYARLSKDDGEDKESNSITNQLQMMRRHCKNNHIEIIDEYVDDGYSGTTFDRPELNRMLQDAFDDKVENGIMVKDMSRFGRNNAMFMYYVGEIFPNHNIQFVALNDNVDTRYDDNELMPFKSIINEYYARDTSRKIRSAKTNIALNGGFNGAFAPYGYKVDPNNKRQLLIDSEASPNVTRIFELARQGHSAHQIARTLCEEGVLVPRAYRANKAGKLELGKGFKFPTDWVGKNVLRILENQVYLGHMVSHKTQNKSFKNKKPMDVPKSEWIVVKNTHQPIIDEETFEVVQRFINVKKRPTKKGEQNLFVGLIQCPDCGRNMAYTSTQKKSPAKFRCRTYVRNTNLCTSHHIQYEALYEIVLTDIQSHVKNMKALGEGFVQEIQTLNRENGATKVEHFKKEMSALEKRSQEIDRMIMALFEQNALGKITDERFAKLTNQYELEQKENVQKQGALHVRIDAEEKKATSAHQFLEVIQKYEKITELNRSVLCELIDSIHVYHPEGKGKDRKQRVEINYRFLSQSL